MPLSCGNYDLCAKEKISELGESKEDGEKHDLKISIIITNIIDIN